MKVGDILYFSPNYKFSVLNWDDKKILIDAFKDRVKGFYIEPARKLNDEGTVFGSIGKTDFQQMKTILPSKDLIEKFESEAKPLNDKVIENCNQIKLLEAMRDNLHSKLMSSELRVN